MATASRAPISKTEEREHLRRVLFGVATSMPTRPAYGAIVSSSTWLVENPEAEQRAPAPHPHGDVAGGEAGAVGADGLEAVRRRQRAEVHDDRLARRPDRGRGDDAVAVDRHRFGARAPRARSRAAADRDPRSGTPTASVASAGTVSASDTLTRRPGATDRRCAGLRRQHGLRRAWLRERSGSAG